MVNILLCIPFLRCQFVLYVINNLTHLRTNILVSMYNLLEQIQYDGSLYKYYKNMNNSNYNNYTFGKFDRVKFLSIKF